MRLCTQCSATWLVIVYTSVKLRLLSEARNTFLLLASEGKLSCMEIINQRNTVVSKMLSWLSAQKLST